MNRHNRNPREYSETACSFIQQYIHIYIYRASSTSAQVDLPCTIVTRLSFLCLPSLRCDHPNVCVHMFRRKKQQQQQQAIYNVSLCVLLSVQRLLKAPSCWRPRSVQFMCRDTRCNNSRLMCLHRQKPPTWGSPVPVWEEIVEAIFGSTDNQRVLRRILAGRSFNCFCNMFAVYRMAGRRSHCIHLCARFATKNHTVYIGTRTYIHANIASWSLGLSNYNRNK